MKRLACFLLGFLLLLYAADTLLVQTDTLSYLTLHEMTHRDDIELAIVGSSVARNHFDPEVITEGTGYAAFNVALPFMGLQGCNAAAKLLYKHHDPTWTVLVAEPYMFEASRESQQTQFRLMPFIVNPIDRLSYYVDLCREDGRWLDRLLQMRTIGITSLEQLNKNLRIRVDTQHYIDDQRRMAAEDQGSTYRGSGYMHPGGDIAENERLKIGAWREKKTDLPAELPEFHQKAILRLKAQCERDGSKFMIVNFPYITASMLAKPEYVVFGDLLADFCRAQGIPFYDFALAKEALLPDLDAHYQNVEHMGVAGTQALSRALCTVLRGHEAGEDLSGLFYPDAEAFLASIDTVVCAWVAPDDAPDAFVADSHHGTHVVPEYRFAARAADGTEMLLRDYDASPRFTGAVPEGHTLRVYARAQGSAQSAVYGDAP